MAKSIQVLKMNACGKKYTVRYTDGEQNPYRIYKHELVWNSYHWTESKKTVEKYATINDCLAYLAWAVNWEGK